MQGYIAGGMAKYKKGVVVVDPYKRDNQLVRGHLRNPAPKVGVTYKSRRYRARAFSTEEMKEISAHTTKRMKELKKTGLSLSKKKRPMFGSADEYEKWESLSKDDLQVLANMELKATNARTAKRRAARAALKRAPNSGVAAKAAKAAKPAKKGVNVNNMSQAQLDAAVEKLVVQSSRAVRAAKRSSGTRLRKGSGEVVKPPVREVEQARRHSNRLRAETGIARQPNNVAKRQMRGRIIY